MWILTQNGKRILGTEGLEEIRVGDPKQNSNDYAIMMKRRRDGQEFSLGFYASKARAVEILKEIFIAQSNYMMIGGSEQTVVYTPPKTFNMPKYNEV